LKALCFLARRNWRDASTKEAQTLPLTAKSQIWSMTAIAASRSSASAKRPSVRERMARFGFCAMDSCGRVMGASALGVQQGRKPRFVAKGTDADD
jgi:hypothetical protein